MRRKPVDFCAKYERNACLGLDLLSDMKNLFHRIKSNQGFNRLNGALALLVLTIFTNPPSSAWAQTAPVITNKPAATIVLAGSGVNFAVGVSGTGPFTYQWYSNGNPLQSSAVEPTNVISTVAGGGVGDFGYATNAALYAPSGVAMDGAGNLYIADRDNERIRKVDANGVITTVAGNGTNGYAGDGGAATNAELNLPHSVAVDGVGNLYIADAGNMRIRKVSVAGSAVLSLADTVLTDSGNYWVIINSPFGSVTSSLFPVTVVMRPVSNQVVLGGDGTLVLDAVTTTNVSSRVWAAASLVPPILWHPVYTNALGGAWRFTDTNAALNISRFYRVSTP